MHGWAVWLQLRSKSESWRDAQLGRTGRSCVERVKYDYSVIDGVQMMIV